MVRVDEGVFDLKDVHDHLCGWREALVQHVFHDVTHRRIELVELL